ncbi:MAG: TROVE domain-containing protein [Deltaproteobacteria bacterium]|nr:TROVE domain-containing protein [Deltaproteobacteria bacterium]
MNKDYVVSENGDQMVKVRSDQVMNNAGGYVFTVNDQTKMLRFLILGSENGSYYVGKDRKIANTMNFLKEFMATEEGALQALELALDVKANNRAYKVDPSLLVLGMALASPFPQINGKAYEYMGVMCATPTQLFDAISYARSFGKGWGRAFKRAISRFYTEKEAYRLSYAMAKYQSRNGWSHKDLLRLTHPVPKDQQHLILYRWATGHDDINDKLFGLVKGLELIKKAEDEETVVDLIDIYKAPFEVVPTEWLKSPNVWRSLSTNMGYISIIRSLARMAMASVMDDPEWVMFLSDRIKDQSSISAMNVHPLQLFLALMTYKNGKNEHGREWAVSVEIVDALEQAFSMALKNVEDMGLRISIGLDVSGSMGGEVLPGISAREAAAAIIKVFQNCGNLTINAFSHNFKRLDIQAGDSVQKIVSRVSGMMFGATDCALPMIDAARKDEFYDLFVVLTDNETWAGHIHPYKALQQYREKINPNAKLVVLATENTEFSIADPSDSGMLDIAGFDANVGNIITDFIKGNI